MPSLARAPWRHRPPRQRPPGTAEPSAAAAALPIADILDVDGSDPATPHADHSAANRTATVHGAPTQAIDPVLNRTVTTFDGVDDALAFPLADAWSPAHGPTSPSP